MREHMTSTQHRSWQSAGGVVSLPCSIRPGLQDSGAEAYKSRPLLYCPPWIQPNQELQPRML